MKIGVFVIWFLIIVIFTSCTLTPDPTTLEEQAYIDAVMNTPLVFSIPKEREEEVWGRIQSWIGRYSSMKIQSVSDYVIETYNPSSGEVDFGYSAIKTIVDDNVEFEVICSCGNMFSGKEAKINAHILAYFALTGEVDPKFIVRKP